MCQTQERWSFYLPAGPDGNIVKNDWQIGCRSDSLKVRKEAFLRGSVVVRRNRKNAVASEFFSFAGLLNRVLCVIGCGSSNHWDRHSFSYGTP